MPRVVCGHGAQGSVPFPLALQLDKCSRVHVWARACVRGVRACAVRACVCKTVRACLRALSCSDDMPVIPDLEEELEEDITRQATEQTNQ